jgi:hypothetical protein
VRRQQVNMNVDLPCIARLWPFVDGGEVGGGGGCDLAELMGGRGAKQHISPGVCWI